MNQNEVESLLLQNHSWELYYLPAVLQPFALDKSSLHSPILLKTKQHTWYKFTMKVFMSWKHWVILGQPWNNGRSPYHKKYLIGLAAESDTHIGCALDCGCSGFSGIATMIRWSMWGNIQYWERWRLARRQRVAGVNKVWMEDDHQSARKAPLVNPYFLANCAYAFGEIRKCTNFVNSSLPYTG